MATTDEREGEAVDTARLPSAHPAPAEGDDIEVVAAEVDEPVGLSRRHALAAAAIAVVLVVIVAVALFTRHSHPTARLRTTSPSTLARAAIAAKASKKPQPGSTPIAVATVEGTATPTTVRAVPPPATASAASTPPTPVPTTAAPPKQYGASVLTWSAPSTLTVAAGHSATLAVTAHNPSDGIVDLAHPLSCTPRLDHSEMCPEMVQRIPSGQSASAQYTIDATGIAKGTYSLSIEGVLTVRVTVS